MLGIFLGVLVGVTVGVLDGVGDIVALGSGGGVGVEGGSVYDGVGVCVGVSLGVGDNETDKLTVGVVVGNTGSTPK